MALLFFTFRSIKGEYYRDEQFSEVYLYDGKNLVHQTEIPKHAAVIITPNGLLERIRIKLSTK